jgi:hypothetical protein
LAEWLKAKALSSSPSATKKKKRTYLAEKKEIPSQAPFIYVLALIQEVVIEHKIM